MLTNHIATVASRAKALNLLRRRDCACTLLHFYRPAIPSHFRGYAISFVRKKFSASLTFCSPNRYNRYNRLMWDPKEKITFFFYVCQLRSSALILVKWVNTGLEVRFLACIVSLNCRDTVEIKFTCKVIS